MFPSFDKLIDSESAENSRLLRSSGFPDPDIATTCLERLRDAAVATESYRALGHPTPPWYQTLQRILAEAPIPLAVLTTVDAFVQQSSDAQAAFELFEQAPRSLEMLARLSCGSPFLTQIVLSQPQTLHELTTERRTAEIKSRESLVDEARRAIDGCTNADSKLSELRKFQRREILRIGMCDAFGLMDLKFVTLQISLLADAMVQTCLEIACQQTEVTEPPFAVIALGKHGGEELNYSSDIDLVLVGDTADGTSQRIARRLIDGLAANMATGFLYRVDMRLRPWGDAGPLVTTVDSYSAYLLNDAKLWEKQALLKARIVAGPKEVGQKLLEDLPGMLFTESADAVLDNVWQMKDAIETHLNRCGKLDLEIKLGAGSIRDIEFLTQSLQLIHGRSEPRTLSANTLDALIRLTDFGFLEVTRYRQLREGYIFFRTVEHALQLLHNQQTHSLPADSKQRYWLARRLDFQSDEQLVTRFREHQRAVRHIFEQHFQKDDDRNTNEAADVDVSTNPTANDFAASLSRHSNSIGDLLSEAQNADECQVLCSETSDHDETMSVLIACPVHPGVLSTVAGVFISNKIDVRQGLSVVGPSKPSASVEVSDGLFLGVFHVTCGAPMTAGALQRTLVREITSYWNQQQIDGRDVVQAALLKTFCDRVLELPESAIAVADLSVSVSSDADSVGTRLDISGDESFGFFFEVANALEICGFLVQRAELGEDSGHIKDVIYVTETDGEAVKKPERVEELRTAITLIKQFTNWLPSNNEPHKALLRFRDLLQRLLRRGEWQSTANALKQPKVLRAVGRVLGISRYLWEDFLLVQPNELLPLLENPEHLERRVSRSELESDCRSRMNDEGPAVGLSSFKDYHLFRIDLRHVLGHCGPFGAFSQEITELAEVVLSFACDIAETELTEKHGSPTFDNGEPCSFTLAALGKFGGIEMGFASDIELFLVFEGECRTGGKKHLSAGSFFERLVARVCELISSRRRGIFEVDLRMRPYGQAGATSISYPAFQRYFAAGGDAWPYERQSLVKLRCIAGNPSFRNTLQSEVVKLVYAAEAFDFDAMKGLREKQVRQLVRGGSINVKLSDGGLVDCEYAVQALQLTFGKSIPELQTSNTLCALQAAVSANLLSHEELHQIRAAYVFLRQLIDCLRMVRGNAEDLTVPERGSADYAGLKRRMHAVHETSGSVGELEKHMETVTAFTARVAEICGPPRGLKKGRSETGR